MKTNEYGYPVFIVTTKHGYFQATVNDKTVEKDRRGYAQDTHPIRLDGLVKINGIEVEVHASFRVYTIAERGDGLYAYS